MGGSGGETAINTARESCRNHYFGGGLKKWFLCKNTHKIKQKTLEKMGLTDDNDGFLSHINGNCDY